MSMKSQPEGKPSELEWHVNAIPRLIIAITEGALVGGFLYWAWNQGAATKPKAKTVQITMPSGEVIQQPLITSDYNEVEQLRIEQDQWRRSAEGKSYQGQTQQEIDIIHARADYENYGITVGGVASDKSVASHAVAVSFREREMRSESSYGTTPINSSAPSTVVAPAGYSQVPTVYVRRGAGSVG